MQPSTTFVQARHSHGPSIRHVALVLLLASVSLAHAQHRHDEMGRVDFPVSCSVPAQQHFNAGLALLHHMMYEQAQVQFDAVAEADAECAMAHWGVAMTQLHPLWDPPTDQAFRHGRDGVATARSLEPYTARERAYVAAIAAYFDDEAAEVGHRQRLVAWAEAQRDLYEAYPEDVDAGAFHALAQLAIAPPEDRTFSTQARAGALLETLLHRAPEHPGLFHYTIHAYDNPVLAQRGVAVARAYDQLAPEVPHALHMPSHIFVRLGLWPDVVTWNRRSADAALRQPVGGSTSLHHIHALDYLIYAYLQQARDDEARAALAEIASIDNYQDSFAAAYGLAAAPARWVLERSRWDEAARLPLRVHGRFPWDRYPWAEAITYFARGLGAARTGDLAAARNALEALDRLHEQTARAGDRYWAVHVDAQRTSIAAWVAHEQQNLDEALALMQRAADAEDSVDKHPVTPGAVLPARELLGEMLLLRDDAESALAAYEASLAISPRRSNALLGAGRAAERAGQQERAAAHYRLALEVLSGDGDRPGRVRAHTWVASQ